MKLVIRADAYNEIGAGHVMRCLAIAHAWQDVGGEVVFACAKIDPSVGSVLQANRIPVAVVDGLIGTQLDAQSTAALAAGAQALVIDGYSFGDAYLQSTTSSLYDTWSMYLDDNAQLSKYPTHFVLNPNIVATPDMYPSVDPRTRLLLGNDFALLRREFTQTPPQLPTQAIVGQPLRILVTMGGSDPENITQLAIHAVSQLDDLNFEARIVLGGMNRHYEELSNIIQGDERLSLLRGVTDMATQYRWSDLAVSAGGGSNWEMCRLGLPRILLVLAENQIATAKACVDAKTAINLGAASTVTPSILANAIRKLANDKPRRIELGENARKLIDGAGAQRVVTQLSLLKPFQLGGKKTKLRDEVETLTFREATMEDAELLLDWRNDSETSAASRNSDRIDMTSHKRWLGDCLTDHGRRLFIAEERGQAVGTVRIDVGDPCELSWTVAPNERRRGVGRRMVRQIASMINLPTKAVTHKENVASQKVAEEAGFELLCEDGDWLTFLLNGKGESVPKTS